MLSNNFHLQTFVGLSCHFLADNFISFFEGAFSNGITRKRQREKAENRRVSIEFSGQVCYHILATQILYPG